MISLNFSKLVHIALIICISINLSAGFVKNLSSRSSSIGFSKRPFETTERDTGYGPLGSLLRQGPVPFFIRIARAETYEAAVLKYMAIEKCDRLTAQANMDAYFQDPNGWASNKLKARKTGIEPDYVNANVDTRGLTLTALWTCGLFFIVFRIFAIQVLNMSP